MDNNNERYNLVKAITSPLGFFALSLLIVEGFLTIVLVFSDLESDKKFLGMLIGAGLFCLVVIGVLVMVWYKPKNLTFGEKSHIEEEKINKKWGKDKILVTKGVVSEEISEAKK